MQVSLDIHISYMTESRLSPDTLFMFKSPFYTVNQGSLSHLLTGIRKSDLEMLNSSHVGDLFTGPGESDFVRWCPCFSHMSIALFTRISPLSSGI